MKNLKSEYFQRVVNKVSKLPSYTVLLLSVTELQIRYVKQTSPVELRHIFVEPCFAVYTKCFYVFWKFRPSTLRNQCMPPWHPWAFWENQDGVQDGGRWGHISHGLGFLLKIQLLNHFDAIYIRIMMLKIHN